MMDIQGTLTSKGQITIPKDVRLLLNLETGDEVQFKVTEDDGVRIQKINKPKSLSGILNHYALNEDSSEEDFKNAILSGVMRGENFDSD